MKAFTTVIARAALAIPFLLFGLMHLAMGDKLAGIVPAWLPGGAFWVYLTGLVLLFGGIGLIAGGRFGVYTSYALALLLLVFILTVHVPGLLRGEGAHMSLISLLKDLGLIGGILTWVGIFARQPST